MKNNLAELRKKHGFSQDRLAARLGVSRQTIISIEKGKYSPSLPLAFQIAKTFDTTIEHIFIYEEETNKKGERTDGIKTDFLYMRGLIFNHDPLYGRNRHIGRGKRPAADMDTSFNDSYELFNGIPLSSVQAKG